MKKSTRTKVKRVNKKALISRLKRILDSEDLENPGVINRALHTEYKNDIILLIDHIGILVQSLRHDNESLKRELFDCKKLLDDDNPHVK